MSAASLKELRRMAEVVARLRDRQVREVVIRSDCRQLRLALSDGQTLLVSVLLDESGKPRLDLDLLRPAEESPGQLEVRFDELA